MNVLKNYYQLKYYNTIIHLAYCVKDQINNNRHYPLDKTVSNSNMTTSQTCQNQNWTHLLSLTPTGLDAKPISGHNRLQNALTITMVFV